MAERIRVVGKGTLNAGPQTAGTVRAEALVTENLWFGEVHTEPRAVSGWHHHAEHATYGYVVSGGLRFEFGSEGRQSVEAVPGDFFIVEPHVVHREGNPSSQEQVLVVMRIGSGPTVINVDGPEKG